MEGRVRLALRGLRQALSITDFQSMSVLIYLKVKIKERDYLCPPLEPAFQMCSTKQAEQQAHVYLRGNTVTPATFV